MEYSENYDFALPTAEDDTLADIGVISENFKTVDRVMKKNENLRVELTKFEGETMDAVGRLNTKDADLQSQINMLSGVDMSEFQSQLDNKSDATNLVNGSAEGSLRGIGAKAEGDGYTIGTYAVATGFDTKASGPASHAEGRNTTASDYYSHAEGHSTTASGECSHAEGDETKASGHFSHAEGYSTEASGGCSHAEGNKTIASGGWSHAEGYLTEANGNYSHAEGEETIAGSHHQHVQGRFNIADNDDKYSHIVGNGSDYETCSNAHTLDWDGNAWFAGDVYVGGTSQDDENAIKLTDISNTTADLQSQIDEKLNNLSLGIASDGLIYLFVNGSPVGAGIPQGVSGDVFGYVDENNTIVLTGNLADGTYNIKYEMEDDSTVDIGELVIDTNTYYSVSNNLTNCTNGNSATQVIGNESYSATISANDGYSISSIVATMGGTDITSSAVSGDTISIAKVTGNIVITAVAEETVVEVINQIPISTDADGNLFVGTNGEAGYKTGYRMSLSSGNETAAEGYECTGFIPVKQGDVVRIKNISVTSENSTNAIFYNSEKQTYSTASTQGATLYNIFVTNGTENNGVYTATFSSNIHSAIDDNLAYIRIGSKEITNDSILTVNQEIV